MIKIKVDFLEKFTACTILPNIGLLFTTCLFVISLIVKQDPSVYKGIFISYAFCFSLMFFSFIVCMIVRLKSRRVLIVEEGILSFSGIVYEIEKIAFSEYYKCKWYCIPFLCVYKQQLGGLMNIHFEDGKKIQFKIFYSDFVKISEKIPNIIIK